MAEFSHYIGIDYSGARWPDSQLRGISVSSSQGDPVQQRATWARRELAAWLIKELEANPRTLVGIDHAFSFPEFYMQRYNLMTWNEFLLDFETHWPTRERPVSELIGFNLRTGSRDEYRFTDLWANTAKSLFNRNVKGQVFYSTHAGIPWLRTIREALEGYVHFWPFDGFEITPGKPVIVEVYPTIIRKRCTPWPRDYTEHQRDAYVVSQWMMERDREKLLACYLNPPLTQKERERVQLEGWIFGVS